MGKRTHGAFAGGEWSRFRYGERHGRRPYLSRAATPRIYNGAERQLVVAHTADVLATATLSKFQHEASARHGLRVGLLYAGAAGWQAADDEAAAIVTAALDKIGARRPTFLQGQREWTIPRENCQRCGAPLDPADAGHRRYCSDLCRESARVYAGDLYRVTESLARASVAYAAAKASVPARPCVVCGTPYRTIVASTRTCSAACALAIRKDRVPPRPCHTCGKLFRPHSVKKTGKFCSRECARLGQIKRPKPCPTCGKQFVPRRADQQNCSNACAAAARAAALAPIGCAQCGAVFQPRTRHARFCSPLCRERERMVRQRAARSETAQTDSSENVVESQ